MIEISNNRNKSRQEGLLEYAIKSGLVLEIGVLEGELSRWILDNLSPKELILSDPWVFIDNYNDYNNKEQEVQEARYKSVVSMFKDQKNVQVIRKTSGKVLESYEDGYFDLIYMDGDHRLEGVILDLILSYKKLKTGGIMVIDDVDLIRTKSGDDEILQSPWPEVLQGFQYFMQGFGDRFYVLDWCSNNIFLEKK